MNKCRNCGREIRRDEAATTGWYHPYPDEHFKCMGAEPKENDEI